MNLESIMTSEKNHTHKNTLYKVSHESTPGHLSTQQSALWGSPIPSPRLLKRHGIQGQDLIKLITLLLHQGYSSVRLAFHLVSSFSLFPQVCGSKNVMMTSTVWCQCLDACKCTAVLPTIASA